MAQDVNSFMRSFETVSKPISSFLIVSIVRPFGDRLFQFVSDDSTYPSQVVLSKFGPLNRFHRRDIEISQSESDIRNLDP